ncbi:methyltransferase [Pseudochryseolinea flava]|uniref:Methyltransferase n=1 Tax=Pseudochryseolinea flava TaxID=2059302 RepID=A0A364Y931_9BACT|nr:methyltransferase [Pseudochryseolinea flava]RAW02752.1 methyltransferase [Pseudochryseolinea flava]
MRKFFTTLVGFPLRVATQWYLSKTRIFRYDALRIRVSSGVFHPGFFFSTRYLLSFLKTQQLTGKKFLELGCGSGVISVFAAKKGARVTACDINEKAVADATENGLFNKVPLTVVHSDLFSNLTESFDWIVINPPYYPADPKDEAQHAWYCGEHHQYFERLFSDVGKYTTQDGKVLMILSEVCDLQTIFNIAAKHKFAFETISERNVWADGKNYLYWIVPSKHLSKSEV